MAPKTSAKPQTKPSQKRKTGAGAPKGNKNAVGNKGGRPYKLVSNEKTLETLSGLAKIQCTTKEAGAVFNVDEKTFIEFLQRDEKARSVWEFGKENGKSSLRRAQLKAALEGNTTMMVWMGKQLLGQKDRLDVGGDPDSPIKNEISFKIEFVKSKECMDAGD
jgi:hypothetical protein